MHIVVLTDFAQFNGGASTVALLSAQGLAQRGHRVTVVAGAGPVDSSLRDIANLTVRCLEQRDIVSNPRRLQATVQGLWNWTAASRVRTILKDLSREDTLVHLHLWGKCLTSSVVRMVTDLGFSMVLTLHDFLAACPTGTLFQHRSRTICTLEPMSRACLTSNCDANSYANKIWRVARQYIQMGPGALPSGIRDFIAISPTCLSVMKDHLPEDARVHMLSNPVDAVKATPVDVSLNSSFVFVGRLVAEKGPGLFAEAAARSGLEALFIGDGPLKGEVLSACPSAVVTGWQSRESTQDLLRSARALVFPSLWRETQGLVVAEALAMGLPVVVADTSAARDWVEDGVTGLLFRSGDPLDLSRKMLWLYEHPAQARRMGEAAYQRYWAAPASLSRHVTELEELYSTICTKAEVLR